MALMNEMPRFTSELGTGLAEGFASMTPYDSTKPNNNAPNPLGALYFRPAPSQGSSSLASSSGYGSGLWMKMVLYKSTGNPAVKAGPAPVYWTDETFTTVSGAFADGYVASSAASQAGWLLPNAGTVAGIGAGTTLFTATLLNNGGNGSYVWIGLRGFIPSAYLAAGSQGNVVYGSGDFATTGIAQGSNFTHNMLGLVYGVVASNIGDIIATCPVF